MIPSFTQWPASDVWTAETLYRVISSVYPAASVELIVFDRASLSGSLIDSVLGFSWGSAVNATANKFDSQIVAGRRWTKTHTDGLARGLTITAPAAIKEMFAVVQLGTAPALNYEGAVVSDSSGYAVMRDALQNTLLSGYGWTHYVDEIQTDAIPLSGVHVLEGQKSGATSSSMYMLGQGNTNTWSSAVGCVGGITSVSTSEQRAARNAALRRFLNSV